MLNRDNLHDYQRECVEHMTTQPSTMLWLGVGLGKTIITLTSIVDLMATGEAKKTIVFGPLRVINSVWDTEAANWSHTKHLKFSIISGNVEKREKALFARADVYLINYEQMNWLAEFLTRHYISKGKPLPFDFAVYDEVSKLKNSTSKRMKGGTRDIIDEFGKEYQVSMVGWKKIIPHFKRNTGLTGTPAANGYGDLHGQYLAIDNGERLGKHVTHFRENYFTQSFSGWGYEPTELGVKMIEQKISDITKNMSAAEYLDLPAVKIIDKFVDLPPKARRAYEQVEEDMFTTLETGEDIEAYNTVSVYNKVLQFSNGTPYINKFGEEQKWQVLHDEKLAMLESILEEAGGQPILLAYSFKSDAERIMKKFKKYRPVNLTDEDPNKTGGIIKKWNTGKIKLMIAHPASCGHGINGLQKSCNIVVWFGLNWSLELYSQMNGRIDRQGQERPVSIIRVLARDTLDLAVADALDRKHDTQESLKGSINKYRQGDMKSGKISFM